MTTFAPPAVAWAGSREADAPLVVLLHGRGSNEHDILALAGDLPDRFAYAAVRAPIAEGGGYAWFANRGIGRPVAESLADTMAWFGSWLDDVAAILSGTLPFDAGVPTSAGRLDGVRVLVAHGDADNVIPRDLLERTWQYLHDGSGARVVGVRDPGGHGISAAVFAALDDWLSAVLAADGTSSRARARSRSSSDGIESLVCEAALDGAHEAEPNSTDQAQGMCTPLMLRATTSRWISEVPSKIV